ncbi:MAG: YjjG family noncanonical pyrimidine nucleotidase [Flavobacteriales bacterium]
MKPNYLDITDVFFDLDHTLWDFDKNSKLAFKRVFNKNNMDINFDDFIKVYEPINLEYWRLFRNEKVSKQELRRGRLINSFKKLNLKFSIEIIDQLAENYIEELPLDNHLFKDALEVLNYLSKKYTLHIITNGFKNVQQQKITNSGIKKYVTTITTSEEVGVKKPNPKIFFKALDKAKTKPQNSIMIGDSFEADIQGAKKIGMKTLYFNDKNITFDDEINQIYSLKEIYDYL